jgi:hypothetical protein
MAFYLNINLYKISTMNYLNENIHLLNITRKNTPIIEIIKCRRKRENYEKKVIYRLY